MERRGARQLHSGSRALRRVWLKLQKRMNTRPGRLLPLKSPLLDIIHLMGRGRGEALTHNPVVGQQTDEGTGKLETFPLAGWGRRLGRPGQGLRSPSQLGCKD